MSVVYVGRDAVDAAKQRSLVSFFKPVAVASSTRDADSSSHVDQDDEVEVLQAGGADGYEVGSDAGEPLVQRSALEAEDDRLNRLAIDFLTPYQKRNRSKRWKGRFEVQKLYTLNQVRKCATSHRRVALAKRIFIYLADHDVGGVRRLMGQTRRDGLSMNAILHRLEQAVGGTYKAKGYSEDEFDLAILAMRIGGQAMLHALHQAAGFLGATAVYAKIAARSMKFVVCASLERGCLIAAITANLQRFAGLYEGEKGVIILQIDEIATDQRARYNGPTDEEGGWKFCILGLCVQHTSIENTKFGGISNLENLSKNLDTVIAAMALGRRPHYAIPVAAFARCKTPNPQQQMRVLKTVSKICAAPFWCGSRPRFPFNGIPTPTTEILEVWEDGFAGTIGPIVLLASDRDGVRRPMFFDFTSAVKSTQLAPLKLIDSNTSICGVVQSFDMKHNHKRSRTRDLSQKGVTISGEGLPLNRDSYPALFRWYDGKPEKTYSSLFNVDDKQNVGLAVRLMANQVEVANADQDRVNELATKPGLAALHRDLKVKAAIAEDLLAVLCDPAKTVGQLLEGLSRVSHLLLIIFRARRTAFMTGQLYHDLQATIRGIYFCALKVQQHCPAMDLYLWQIGTDALENSFAVVRTLTHASNVDGKELGDRLGAAVALEKIYAKHPNWAKKSRRLNDSIDHMNVKTWSEAGPAGGCDVRGLDVVDCWNYGRRAALRVLQAHDYFADVT
eukprot:jgi/Undpi1/13018/HiC_scaffold_8.g02681.m1